MNERMDERRRQLTKSNWSDSPKGKVKRGSGGWAFQSLLLAPAAAPHRFKDKQRRRDEGGWAGKAKIAGTTGVQLCIS